MRADRRVSCALLLAVLGSAAPALAADDREILPGAFELGLAGSLASTDGSTRVSLALRGGSFLSLGPGLLGLEAELGYARVRELDRLDVLGNVAWLYPAGAAYPFVAATAGTRQEWLGSFRNARAPVGWIAGLRVLMGESAALRAEYRWLHVFDEPLPDFDEHHVLVGVSVLLGNGRSRAGS